MKFKKKIVSYFIKSVNSITYNDKTQSWTQSKNIFIYSKVYLRYRTYGVKHVLDQIN